MREDMEILEMIVMATHIGLGLILAYTCGKLCKWLDRQ